MGPDQTSLAEVRSVLGLLRSLSCRHWLEGGWGVDALVGRQTRRHRDVDVDFDVAREGQVLEALADLGYVVDTDWRPNRVELRSDGHGRVDLHPLQIAADGSARQASLTGGWHDFPPSYFTTGRIGALEVPCVSLEAQLAFHSGYELREADRHDLELLQQLAPVSDPARSSRGGSRR